MERCLKGIVCANITPFDKYNQVDYESLKNLVRYLVDSGINAIYPAGTNGEGLSLTLSERKKITKTMVDTAGSKTPVAIQCGTQTLEDTMELIRDARENGAAAAGILTPFFFRQTQEALFEYYSSIFKTVKNFPLYIYNIPSHTNNDILPVTMDRLSKEYENFIGVKYSHPDIMRIAEYIEINNSAVDALIGCDKLIYPAAKIGAVGTVSGPAAVFPELFASLWHAVEAKDEQRALHLQKIISQNDKVLETYQSIPMLKIYLKISGIIENSSCRIPFQKIENDSETGIYQKIMELKDVNEEELVQKWEKGSK